MIDAVNIGKNVDYFAYRVSLSLNHQDPQQHIAQAYGTVPLSSKVTQVIFRIANPEACLSEETRIENAVCMMILMAEALSSYRHITHASFPESTAGVPRQNMVAGS